MPGVGSAIEACRQAANQIRFAMYRCSRKQGRNRVLEDAWLLGCNRKNKWTCWAHVNLGSNHRNLLHLALFVYTYHCKQVTTGDTVPSCETTDEVPDKAPRASRLPTIRKLGNGSDMPQIQDSLSQHNKATTTKKTTITNTTRATHD